MSLRIKVLYITANANLWGDNIALLNFFDQMNQRNIEPFVIVPRKGPFSAELEIRKIKYASVAYHFSVYPPCKTLKDVFLFFPRILRIIIKNILAQKEIRNIAQLFIPDIVHTNVGPIHVGFNVARQMGIKHIWHIREYQDLDLNKTPMPSKVSFTEKISKSHLISISEDLFRHFNMKSPKDRVIIDGVLSKNSAVIIFPKDKYFLFVGRLTAGKGILDLIHAFAKVQNCVQGNKLLIAGTGLPDFEALLKRTVSEYGINDCVQFLGYRKDVSDLMRTATAVVVPSKCEGFGFVTVEAMFNGCLVIARNSGGTREIITTKGLGLLFNTDEQLQQLLQNVSKYNQSDCENDLRFAMDTAVQRYSIEDNSLRLFDFYKEVLNNRSL